VTEIVVSRERNAHTSGECGTYKRAGVTGDVTFNPAIPIPEPSLLILLGIGIIGVIAFGWKYGRE
jgi:hypothetical protein